MDHPPSIKAAFRRRESQSGRRPDPGQHLLREISGQYPMSKLEISSPLRSHRQTGAGTFRRFLGIPFVNSCHVINAFDEITENLNKEVFFF